MKSIYKIILISLFAANVNASPLMLECDAKGTFDTERLDPEKVTISVEEIGKEIYIEVLGSMDYQMGIGSKSFASTTATYSGVNLSDKNHYSASSRMTKPDASSEGTITINRVNGALTLLSFTTFGGKTHATSITGTCKKVSPKNAF